MRLTVERRSVALGPPAGMDTTWVGHALRDPEIAENFAWGGALTGADIVAGRRAGRLVLGIIRRAVDGTRTGFAVMLPPHEGKDFWELLAAIPRREHRDAFSMIHAIDAMSHYMLDHVGVFACGATVRPENTASLAVARRIGYRQREMRDDVNGVPHCVFVLDRAAWAARRARLERECPAFTVRPG